MRIKALLRLIAVLFVLLSLTACGGGGGGGAPSDAPATWDNSNWDQANWQ